MCGALNAKIKANRVRAACLGAVLFAVVVVAIAVVCAIGNGVVAREHGVVDCGEVVVQVANRRDVLEQIQLFHQVAYAAGVNGCGVLVDVVAVRYGKAPAKWACVVQALGGLLFQVGSALLGVGVGVFCVTPQCAVGNHRVAVKILHVLDGGFLLARKQHGA